jgi:acyl-CoA reductase-like NAD-dependent aldehyde dehydrogenase
VLADADLDYAVEAAAFAAFFHQGQICITTRDGAGHFPI